MKIRLYCGRCLEVEWHLLLTNQYKLYSDRAVCCKCKSITTMAAWETQVVSQYRLYTDKIKP